MEQMQICQVCKKKPAAWHITDIVDGHPRDLHLCDDCAREKAEGQVSISDFLNSLVKGSAKQVAKMSRLVCSRCGMSYLDFHTQRRLGCPYDYEAFGESMTELLQKIHGETRHVGKVPCGEPGQAARQAELRRLRQALRRAIDQERYEEAARLRDHITKLEMFRGAPE